MKKVISITLDEKLWIYIKNKTNKSRYIEELIKQDLQQQQVKPIVKAVGDELLASSVFFDELASRLARPTQSASIPSNDVFVPPSPRTGYPCCQKASPCKHWSFDGLNDVWVNSLTGMTRE